MPVDSEKCSQAVALEQQIIDMIATSEMGLIGHCAQRGIHRNYWLDDTDQRPAEATRRRGLRLSLIGSRDDDLADIRVPRSKV